MNELMIAAKFLQGEGDCTVFDCEIKRSGVIHVTGSGGRAMFLKMLAKRAKYTGILNYRFWGAPQYVRGGSMAKVVSALYRDAELFLLDDPFSHMGERERRFTQNLIRRLNAMGKTFVIACDSCEEFEDIVTGVMTVKSGKTCFSSREYIENVLGKGISAYEAGILS